MAKLMNGYSFHPRLLAHSDKRIPISASNIGMHRELSASAATNFLISFGSSQTASLFFRCGATFTLSSGMMLFSLSTDFTNAQEFFTVFFEATPSSASLIFLHSLCRIVEILRCIVD